MNSLTFTLGYLGSLEISDTDIDLGGRGVTVI